LGEQSWGRRETSGLVKRLQFSTVIDTCSENFKTTEGPGGNPEAVRGLTGHSCLLGITSKNREERTRRENKVHRGGGGGGGGVGSTNGLDARDENSVRRIKKLDWKEVGKHINFFTFNPTAEPKRGREGSQARRTTPQNALRPGLASQSRGSREKEGRGLQGGLWGKGQELSFIEILGNRIYSTRKGKRWGKRGKRETPRHSPLEAEPSNYENLRRKKAHQTDNKRGDQNIL